MITDHDLDVPAAFLALAEEIGITRIARMTRLDSLGLPVVQAIRPGARSMCIGTGKGWDDTAACIGAIMEAFEHHCAESASATLDGSLAVAQLPGVAFWPAVWTASLEGLHVGRRSFQWIQGFDAGTGDVRWVPVDAVNLSADQSRHGLPLLGVASSIGLGAGRTREQAMLQALRESLENAEIEHAVGRKVRALPRVSAYSSACSLVATMKTQDVHLAAYDCSFERTGWQSVAASVWSHDLPFVLSGFGCGSSTADAFDRALSEAVQTRISVIAGARDDFAKSLYAKVDRPSWPSLSIDNAGEPRDSTDAADLARFVDWLCTSDRSFEPTFIPLADGPDFYCYKAFVSQDRDGPSLQAG